ncbi:MAG: hypothetical protein CFE33_12695 [Pseudorhodobacter sp. PARRP1]|nr:MAG: hypothetical protein CFE33_12695 [Pseudorhodobacter sp. PARRP1]
MKIHLILTFYQPIRVFTGLGNLQVRAQIGAQYVEPMRVGSPKLIRRGELFSIYISMLCGICAGRPQSQAAALSPMCCAITVSFETQRFRMTANLRGLKRNKHPVGCLLVVQSVVDFKV